MKAAGACLPEAPGAGRLAAPRRVGGRESAVIGAEEVVALSFRDRREILLPGVGEEGAGATLVEPADLLLTQEKDAAQDELRDAVAGWACA